MFIWKYQEQLQKFDLIGQSVSIVRLRPSFTFIRGAFGIKVIQTMCIIILL